MILKTGRSVRVAAAAALAAVAVSACGGPTEPKPWPTATDNPSPVAAKVAEKSGEGSTPPVASIKWQDVSGEVDLPRDTEGAQYGLDPKPGVAFGFYDAAGDHQLCTLGAAIDGGFLTAGHCTAALRPTPVELSRDQDAYMSEQVAFGTVTGAADDGVGVDSAVIRGVTVPDAAIRIAGRYPVAGVLTPAAVRTLPEGTPICIDGAKSGLVCSSLRFAPFDGYITTTSVSRKGDSGSAVFVVDPENRALLIGITSGGSTDKTDGYTTYLEPALRRLGAKALIDKDASATFTGPEFSTLVTVR
ncbi:MULTISPECIES: hypothetical protein [Mycolicibacterium]|uniref:hypothetical protein n=1 Tax=Mycolicibacterium TaxID=1866885 RepID=UPI0007EB13DF|nr:hypothetical protein [Mycolicibacterium fortuitum]OBG24089.1 hypothetical protein A5768_22215 [Mycolicibacterium fortuitum]